MGFYSVLVQTFILGARRAKRGEVCKNNPDAKTTQNDDQVDDDKQFLSTPSLWGSSSQ
jgi:hypothetical protein